MSSACAISVSPDALAAGRAALLAAGYQLAQFTDEEQKCIAGKMETMKGEDKEQDQKIAIAIKHCAPEKSKNMSATPPPLPRRYLSDRNADGTWNVRDVPITAVADDLGEDMKWLTREWLAKAIAAAAKKHADDGYLPPLHVDHHFRGEEVRGAGRFLLRRLGEHLYEGKPRLFAFADLLRIRPEVFDEIRKGELPYRSIEALDYANRSEVDSLALGDHWVPFFRMPLLDGDAIEVQEIKTFRARAVPVACLAAAGTIRWITLTGGKAMSEQIEEKSERKSEKKAGGRFGAALAKIAADLAKLAAEADGDDGEGLPDMAPAEQSSVPTMAMATQEGANAALLARVAAVEKRAKDAEDKSKSAALLDACERDARRYGITRGDLDKKLAAHGPVYVQAFVDSLKSHGTPLDETEPMTATAAAASPDEPEIAKYQAHGPAALVCARKLAAEWRGSRMLKSAGTLDQYIETNLALTMAEGR